MPFLLLVAGYTFILMIDKVMFDNHSKEEEIEVNDENELEKIFDEAENEIH